MMSMQNVDKNDFFSTYEKEKKKTKTLSDLQQKAFYHLMIPSLFLIDEEIKHLIC